MVECIETGKKPVYEEECFECKSLLRYTRADVSLMHIKCPVCGCSVFVSYRRVDDDDESTVQEASGKASFDCSAPNCLDCERNDECNSIGMERLMEKRK